MEDARNVEFATGEPSASNSEFRISKGKIEDKRRRGVRLSDSPPRQRWTFSTGGSRQRGRLATSVAIIFELGIPDKLRLYYG